MNGMQVHVRHHSTVKLCRVLHRSLFMPACATTVRYAPLPNNSQPVTLFPCAHPLGTQSPFIHPSEKESPTDVPALPGNLRRPPPPTHTQPSSVGAIATQLLLLSSSRMRSSSTPIMFRPRPVKPCSSSGGGGGGGEGRACDCVRLPLCVARGAACTPSHDWVELARMASTPSECTPR